MKEKFKKYINEASKPKKGTLYIDNSSIFDNPANKYDIKLFMQTLKAAGATKVWKADKWGWSNQPEVVLFTGLDKDQAESALEELPVFKRWGVLIKDANKDWD